MDAGPGEGLAWAARAGGWGRGLRARENRPLRPGRREGQAEPPHARSEARSRECGGRGCRACAPTSCGHGGGGLGAGPESGGWQSHGGVNRGSGQDSEGLWPRGRTARAWPGLAMAEDKGARARRVPFGAERGAGQTPPRPRESESSSRSPERAWRPPGISLVSGGATAMPTAALTLVPTRTAGPCPPSLTSGPDSRLGSRLAGLKDGVGSQRAGIALSQGGGGGGDKDPENTGGGEGAEGSGPVPHAPWGKAALLPPGEAGPVDTSRRRH